MPVIVAALPYIAAAGAALGALDQSQQQQAQLTMEANANEMDALALKQQAAQANVVAGMEEEAKRRENRAFAGEQRAAMAEAGTGLLSSTNQALVAQSAFTAEQDALNIRYGGLLEAHGLTQKSEKSTFAAKAARWQTKRVRASGYLNAATSALSAYSGAGGRFGGGKTTGGVT
jgi:hypothetical protein